MNTSVDQKVSTSKILNLIIHSQSWRPLLYSNCSDGALYKALCLFCLNWVTTVMLGSNYMRLRFAKLGEVQKIIEGYSYCHTLKFCGHYLHFWPGYKGSENKMPTHKRRGEQKENQNISTSKILNLIILDWTRPDPGVTWHVMTSPDTFLIKPDMFLTWSDLFLTWPDMYLT